MLSWDLAVFDLAQIRNKWFAMFDPASTGNKLFTMFDPA